MKLSILLFLISSVSVSSTISGDISDTNACGPSLIEASCEFEVDPDRRRRNRRRTQRLVGGRVAHLRRLPGKEDEDPGADGFINSCTVFVNGTEFTSTIKDLDYGLVEYDEDVKGDGTKLELFASLVSLDNTTITGLFKLEAFDYDDANSDNDEDRITTLKTYSVAWSGC